jgi:hypothetical protein
MTYQFGHIMTLSRKGTGSTPSVRKAMLEAARIDGNAPHVANPKPPDLLFGVDPVVALEFHDQRIAALGKKRGRGAGLRQDSHTMAAAVFSFPCKVGEVRSEYYLGLRDDSLAWFRAEIEALGGEVLGAVQHTDEENLHIHVYGMNLKDARLNAKMLHRGHVAAATAKRQGRNPTADYKAAMRGWQNAYNDVTIRYGLTKIGPGRRRLSRAQHMIEVAEAGRQADRIFKIDQKQIELRHREVELQVAEDLANKAHAIAVERTQKMQAISTGLKAWVADEIDDYAAFAASVSEPRRAQIISAIMPAGGTVITLIRKIGATAMSFVDDLGRSAYRQDVLQVAESIDQATSDRLPGPGPGET